MSGKPELAYPVFKLIVGVMCLILSAEYGWAYIIHSEASFAILYIGDMFAWFLASGILTIEALYRLKELFDAV